MRNGPQPNKHSGKMVEYAVSALVGGLVGVVLSRNFFEGEKKITHRLVVDYEIGNPQFTRTMSQLLGPPLVEGNSVQILEDGAEIFPAMLGAIAAAQRTITFENFVFSKGRITFQFATALAAAARRGVKVHFLQDAAGCNCVHGSDMRILKKAGVEVEIFRYYHLRFNERTHRKLLIIDGKVGFIGGVAISDDWEGHGETPDRWRDTQYRVEGVAVAQMQQAFLDNWIQTRGVVLHGEGYFPETSHEGKLLCQAFQSSSAEGADSARLMFLFSIAAARRSIRIANAYFIPDDLTVSTLIEAAERGVEIEVIVPSEYIDQRIVRFVGRSRWKPMLDSGIRFYEYQPARYHCKYMIVDDLWTTVGSCNFDNRSLRLNEEANLNILDAGFAMEHSKIFEKDKVRSRQITKGEWDHRPVSEKFLGNLGCVFRTQL